MSHMDVPAHERVDSPEQVRINGVNYRIEGGVQRFLASTFPQKIVTGDYEEESHPLVSSITWTDFSGGMLKHVGKYPEDGNRTYFTTLNGWHEGHLTIGPDMLSLGDSKSDTYITGLTTYQGSIYTVSDTGLVQLVDSATTTDKISLTSPATDLYSGAVDGTRFLMAAEGDRIQWTDTGVSDTTWSANTSENITKITTWRDLLWGVNDSAELFFASEVSSSLEWTKVAQVQLEDTGLVTELFVGPDEQLYAASRRGLHVYDNTLERFDHVMDLPFHRRNGDAVTVSGTSIFYSQGIKIFRFTPSFSAGGTKFVDEVGLDRDGGVTAARRGYITAMAHTNRFLFAQVNLFNTATSIGGIYAFNGEGWGAIHNGPTGEDIGDGLLPISNSSLEDYHLVTTARAPSGASRVSKISVRDLDRMPAQELSTNWNFHSAGGFMQLPWIRATGKQRWNALAVEVSHNWLRGVGSLDDSQDRISISYETDFNDLADVDIGTVRGKTDSDGTTLFMLNGGKGVPFNAFRLLVSESRSDSESSPDITRLTVTYTKTQDPLWGFSMVVDAGSELNGRSPQQIRDDLKSLFSSTSLVSFTFKGDGGTDESYRVHAVDLKSVENTGFDDAGKFELKVVEVN